MEQSDYHKSAIYILQSSIILGVAGLCPSFRNCLLIQEQPHGINSGFCYSQCRFVFGSQWEESKRLGDWDINADVADIRLLHEFAGMVAITRENAG